MSETAFQTKYRKETIMGFEQNQSLLRQTVTTEADINGNSAVFLVADSGDATAVTRGVNGLIPARADNNNQYTATLVEWHDKVRKTGFNVYASQGDQRKIMQQTSRNVLNRKIDQDILDALSTATLTAGAAKVADLDLVMHAKTILGNNDVPMDGQISGVITPAFQANLMKTTEFASADYVERKPFSTDLESFRWAGINFIVHPNLAGKGTSAEICYFYHKSSVGHAANMADMEQKVGYDEEDDYSFARASIFMGGKRLQNTGIVKVTHDGSNYAAV